MIRINLLPVRAVQKREQLRSQLVILVLSVVLVVVGCAAVYMSMDGKIRNERAAIDQKNRRIAQLRKTIGEVGRFKKMQEELRGKLEVLQTLKRNRSGPVHILDELNRSLPPKLWLTKFSENGPNVQISGVGLNEETVAKFMRALEKSPYFRNIRLKVTEQMTKNGLKLQRFDIAAQKERPKD
ncbi:type IV pilus assembly protein PilN [Geothermobacter ehrlichii]|uniref:Type IV pilus assembly protein PilN n=1 Tax=Geothermobacter ehrlichii TaxID=213224 RepID=A0A5D3WN11_9BACT|nr:PilN domain-containing protein [Geothermobacter ehrlichii]TYO99957.1 type IV pilus assembly protein PilN [Geothermobacter ehrlichii]